MNTDTAYRNRGPVFALLLALAWAGLHGFGVFALDIAERPLLGLATGAGLVWVYVGLFIVGHDAIHETLFGRGNPWNRRVGGTIHFLYAGFGFDTMKRHHIAHHLHPGTERDPDFNARNPRAFWPWYVKFFTTYFGPRQLLVLTGLAALQWLLGAKPLNLVLLWGVPAILSSFQLFYFGTYLTHRHGGAFADAHKARSNTYPNWLSLLTCFHFGYHHEHHLYPEEPWWRLPLRRAETLRGGEAARVWEAAE